ncbi:MAG: TonB-dependent receptor [Lewinella sp.]|nr:TonB-dependent receptor [Lewinella sp.]
MSGKQYQFRQSYNLFRTISVIFVMLPLWVGAQTVLVTGEVVDAGTGAPIMLANILVEETGQGTSADFSGQFMLEVDSNATLVISSVGYETLRRLAGEVLGDPRCALQPTTVAAVPQAIQVWAPRPWFLLDRNTTGQLALKKEQLTPYDGLNLATAFDGLPGVQVQQGALNTNRLSIRGVGARTPFGTDQVRVYWNDIPITNGAGESALEDLGSGLMRGAQVERGPSSAATGAGLGGAILLNSQPDNRTNWSPALTLVGGSFGRNRQVASLHNRNAVNDWRQDLTLARTASDGYRRNNQFERFSANVLGHRHHRPGIHTRYLLHAQQLSAEIPSSLNVEDFAEDPRQAAANWAAVRGREDEQLFFGGLQHQRLIFENREVGSLRVRGSGFASYRTNDEVRPFNVLRETARQWGARALLHWQSAESRMALRGQWTLGAEWFGEAYTARTFETLEGGTSGDQLEDQLQQRQQYFLFLSIKRALLADWPLLVDLDLVLRRQRYQLERPAPALTPEGRTAFLPGVTLQYPLRPNIQVWLRWRQGMAFPNPEEWLTTYRLTGQRLRPARGNNFELGLRGELAGWLVELTAYYMPVRDALVGRQAREEGIFYENAGEVLHQGIELMLDKEWIKDPFHLRTIVQYTLGDYRFRDFSPPGGDFAGNQLPGAPRHRVLSRLDLGLGPWFGRLTWDVSGRMALDDANTGYTDAYQLLHWRMGWAPGKTEGRSWRLYAGLNNLLDIRYAAMIQVNAQGFGGALPRYYYPGLPRHFYLGVQWEWK